MDGTLTRAIHDFDAIRNTLKLPAGKPILESIANLPTEEAARKHRELDELEYDIAAQATAQPGAADLLSKLTSSGASVGIVTRNGKGIAKATLQAAGLGHYFQDEFIISRECCAPKPNPDGVQLLLKRFSGSAEHSVMIGDFKFDLEAGKLAGATTVHMDVNGEFPWPELTDVSVNSLLELQRLIADS